MTRRVRTVATDDGSAVELPLTGGNASACVVRVGDTVRKPWSRAAPAVAAFTDRLAARGVDLPRSLGRDELGRQILEYVPGDLAMHRGPLSIPELERVGRMVRSIHDAAAGFAPPVGTAWDVLIPVPDADLICHNDLAPWNLIVGERWVFIDWDGAGPSTRSWDLAYAAQAFTLNDPAVPAETAAARLAAFVAGYGADDALRSSLPKLLAQRAAAMYDLLGTAHVTGRQPWATMYTEGHGAHWRSAAAYAARYEQIWRAALGG